MLSEKLLKQVAEEFALTMNESFSNIIISPIEFAIFAVSWNAIFWFPKGQVI